MSKSRFLNEVQPLEPGWLDFEVTEIKVLQNEVTPMPVWLPGETWGEYYARVVAPQRSGRDPKITLFFEDFTPTIKIQ